MAVFIIGSIYVYAVSVLFPAILAFGPPSAISYTRLSAANNNTKCGVRGLVMNIYPPADHAGRCQPKRIKTFGCKGQCYSYTEVNSNLTRITRSCSCCQPTDFGLQKAVIRCQGGMELRKVVKFAINCHCRPCILKPRVTLADLRHMLHLSNSRSRWGNKGLGNLFRG